MPGLPSGFKTVPSQSVRKNGCGICGVSGPLEDARVVSLLQSYGSKNRGSGPVCLFVNCDPSILYQADDNLEATGDPDQATNRCEGRRVRKRRKTWPQWRTQEFCSRGGLGLTNSVEDRENGDLGAVAP